MDEILFQILKAANDARRENPSVTIEQLDGWIKEITKEIGLPETTYTELAKQANAPQEGYRPIRTRDLLLSGAQGANFNLLDEMAGIATGVLGASPIGGISSPADIREKSRAVRDRIRESGDRFREEHPVADIAASTYGALIPAIATGGKAGGALSRAGALTRVGASVGTAAGFGALAGAGAATENRGEAALRSGAVGGAAGLILGPVAQLLTSAGRGAAGKVGQMMAPAAARIKKGKLADELIALVRQSTGLEAQSIDDLVAVASQRVKDVAKRVYGPLDDLAPFELPEGARAIVSDKQYAKGAWRASGAPAEGPVQFGHVQGFRQALEDRAESLSRRGFNHAARSVRQTLREFDDIIEPAIPGFREANRAFAQAQTAREAIDKGTKAWGKLTPRQVERELQELARDAGPHAQEAVEAYRLGMAQRVVDQMTKASTSGSAVPNFAGREKLLRAVFPDKETLMQFMRMASGDRGIEAGLTLVGLPGAASAVGLGQAEMRPQLREMIEGIYRDDLVPTSLGEAMDAAGAMASTDRERIQETPGTLVPEIAVGLTNVPGSVQALRDVIADFRADHVGWGTALAGLGIIPGGLAAKSGVTRALNKFQQLALARKGAKLEDITSALRQAVNQASLPKAVTQDPNVDDNEYRQALAFLAGAWENGNPELLNQSLRNLGRYEVAPTKVPFKRLVTQSLLDAPDGVTVKSDGAPYASDEGYAVGGVIDKPTVLSPEEYTPEAVAKFVEEHWTPDRMLGSWKDANGNVHLDVSDLHPTRAEAIRVGSERNQQSVWSFKDADEITVPRRIEDVVPGLTAEQARDLTPSQITEHLGLSAAAVGAGALAQQANEGEGVAGGAKGAGLAIAGSFLGAPALARLGKAARRIADTLSEDRLRFLSTKESMRDFDAAARVAPNVESQAAGALAGQVKRGWYENSANALVETFGPDAPRFAALLAAMSPQQGVEVNLDRALNAWHAWDAAGRPKDTRRITNLLNAVGRSTNEGKELGARIPNSIRALQSEDPATMFLSGPKVDAFHKNLLGDVQRVTLDTWMAQLAAVRPSRLSRGVTSGVDDLAGSVQLPSGSYLANEGRINETAELLSRQTGRPWTPAEVQETLWSWGKTFGETVDPRSSSRLKTLANTDVESVIPSVTPDRVAEAPDFANLLGGSRFAPRLEAMGLTPPVPFGTAIGERVDVDPKALLPLARNLQRAAKKDFLVPSLLGGYVFGDATRRLNERRRQRGLLDQP